MISMGQKPRRVVKSADWFVLQIGTKSNRDEIGMEIDDDRRADDKPEVDPAGTTFLFFSTTLAAEGLPLIPLGIRVYRPPVPRLSAY